MKRIYSILVFQVVLFLGLVAGAKPVAQKGFVILDDQIPRYVEYTPASKPGLPLVVLVNGLVYDLERWSKLREELQQKGYGTLNYYIRGQFKTLKAELEKTPQPIFFKTGLETKQLATELKDILATLKVNQPVVLVGLSYGGSVAAEFAEMYPQSLSQLFMMAPVVMSSDRYNPQGAWIYQNLELIKLWWGPFLGKVFYEQAYKAIYQSYLNQRIVPERVPDEMKDIPDQYRESIFHLVRAARSFDLRKYRFSGMQESSVHFLLAKESEEKVFADQVTSYEGVATAAQGSLIFLTESEHAIPDSQPRQAALYMDLLIKKDSRLKAGSKYKATSEGLFNW